jgi:flagellar protein FliO/FliZ
MDMLSMLRTLGALGLVLGMLAAALWAVKRYDIKLPGRVSGTNRKRVEMVERLSIGAKRSVALIRRDGCEHLILLGPEGSATIETGIVSPAAPTAAAPAPQPVPAPEPVTILAPVPVPTPVPAAANDVEAFTTSFGDLVELSPATPRKPRTRRPRDTKRWNRAAVREALNA